MPAEKGKQRVQLDVLHCVLCDNDAKEAVWSCDVCAGCFCEECRSASSPLAISLSTLLIIDLQKNVTLSRVMSRVTID